MSNIHGQAAGHPIKTLAELTYEALELACTFVGMPVAAQFSNKEEMVWAQYQGTHFTFTLSTKMADRFPVQCEIFDGSEELIMIYNPEEKKARMVYYRLFDGESPRQEILPRSHTEHQASEFLKIKCEKFCLL
jgi:hypothetical protein